MAGASSSSHPNKEEKERPRFFDAKAKALCWQKADVVPGRHPERWRKDAAGNIVCKRFWNCQGCLCYEYDHIIPFSKGISFFLSSSFLVFSFLIWGTLIFSQCLIDRELAAKKIPCLVGCLGAVESLRGSTFKTCLMVFNFCV